MEFLFLLLFVGAVVLIIVITKDAKKISKNSSSSYTSNPISNRKSNTDKIIVANNENKISITDYIRESNYQTIRQSYIDAINCYRTYQSIEAIALFKNCAQSLEQFKLRYPNNLLLNFHLLEAYEGYDREKAIEAAYQCISILRMIPENEYHKFVSTEFDVNRKLYKMLIKLNRLEEAKKPIRWIKNILKMTIADLNQRQPSSEEAKKMISQVLFEGKVAIFFLVGILENRDVQRNLVENFDSPELSYFFNANNGSDEAEMAEFTSQHIANYGSSGFTMRTSGNDKS